VMAVSQCVRSHIDFNQYANYMRFRMCPSGLK